MEYEYIKAVFKKASEAVIAFENGTELFLMNAPCLATDSFTTMNIHSACAGFDKLYTRKEKAIDFEKEFTLDTPWMVMDCKVDVYVFAFACVYLPMASHKFIALAEGIKSKHTPYSIEWDCARHLTKEEEIKYLGAEK